MNEVGDSSWVLLFLAGEAKRMCWLGRGEPGMTARILV